jgi:hypothetical protein
MSIIAKLNLKNLANVLKRIVAKSHRIAFKAFARKSGPKKVMAMYVLT